MENWLRPRQSFKQSMIDMPSGRSGQETAGLSLSPCGRKGKTKHEAKARGEEMDAAVHFRQRIQSRPWQ